MRSCARACFVLSFAATTCLPALANAVVPVVFGQSWDPSSQRLQSIMDAEYGAGTIDCAADYIGAHAGDPDPWFWVGDRFSALLVREVAGNANRNTLGWYEEEGHLPVIDGVNDGVVFDGPATAGATRLIVFNHLHTKFGFYMNPNGTLGATNAPEPEKFYTNRLLNDRGPDGHGAVHAPYDGDVQALVYDVSRWRGADTWLVCFEDLDSGATPGPCCATTDNDFNDLIFEVKALGATPATALSFGGLKIRYR
jgi:hypothetical protein